MRISSVYTRMSRNRLLLAIVLGLAPAVIVAQQTLKVDVDLVNVFVTVQGNSGDFVSDLRRDDFVLYDDDQPQRIDIFEKDSDVHSALGVLLDISGSMVDIIPYMNRGVKEFARTISSPDEYSVITFGTNVRLIHRSPQPQQHLDTVLQDLKPWGTSVLFDAMLYGMDRVKMSANARKALIIFTDGTDNGSKEEFNRVLRDAQLSGVVLYFVAIGSPVLVDKHTVDTFASNSGGRVFYVPKGEAIGPYLERIRAELARQYYLGYYISKRPGYHRLRVEVPNRSNLKVHTRAGYLGQ
jgi:Ca-activated chloride channel homolog